jgi:ferritin-like metal-binding protein YciE
MVGQSDWLPMMMATSALGIFPPLQVWRPPHRGNAEKPQGNGTPIRPEQTASEFILWQANSGSEDFPMKTLAEIFEHTLEDIYYAENAITKALPKVAKAATDAKLRKAAEDHLAETKDQIKKLEQVFKSIGKKAEGTKCDAIEGLIKEADGLMDEASGTALNAGLLAACQAVEHYEISRYGSLREWAKDLGHDDAHKLLSEILDQEKATNNKLTNLAVTSINKTSTAAKAA